MAVVQHNVVKTQQVGTEVFVEMGSDKATGQYIYVDAYQGWASRVPLAGSSHPEFPALYLKSLRSTVLDGGQVRVVCDYESYSAQATYPGRPAGGVKRYDLELSTNEEPLLSHTKLKNLDLDEKYYLSELMGGVDKARAAEIKKKIVSSAGLEAFRLILAGVAGYLNPGMTWVERYSSGTVSGLAGDLGQRDSPPGGAPGNGGRDWIYIGANARNTEDGKAWDIERRWILTAEGGADDFLYS